VSACTWGSASACIFTDQGGSLASLSELVPLAPDLVAFQLGAVVPQRSAAERLEAMARENFTFIWRSLRRLGVPYGVVDDAAQQVFEVASRRLADIDAGRERAFLFKTALLVASESRRTAAVRRERHFDSEIEELADPAPTPEEANEWAQKRALLDEILLAMRLEERTVFVLFELEEFSMAEIAEIVEIPPGTVASRLRRAREGFHAQAKRVRARLTSEGGPR
jgi:RNA polymerase sigma-70 factor, ECF subfamily